MNGANKLAQWAEDVFVELPEEVGAKANKVGKLMHWLYGFRPAAAAWENHYAEKLAGAGFVRGLATLVSFYHAQKDISLVVHGDDFIFVGEEAVLGWAQREMEQRFLVKVIGKLGGDSGDDKELRILTGLSAGQPRALCTRQTQDTVRF